jgi:hypothetical protein
MVFEFQFWGQAALGQRRRNSWAVSWKKMLFHFNQGPRRLWSAVDPLRPWERTAWHILGSVTAHAEDHVNFNI